VPVIAFDFDSTLIRCESLDEILARALRDRPERAAEVRAITDAGMEGRIPFVESVRRRLAITRLRRDAVEAFADEAVGLLTPGIAALIGRLDAEVWIVSGALREVLLPAAAHLGVPGSRVLGTVARWSRDGGLEEFIDCREKADLLAGRTDRWDRPRTIVGDGMSDHAVFARGLVDRFVAFTAHARRAAVVATGAPEARDVRELEYLLVS
jgi:HAD superfamily phosphoserine phosphatase-like hydrolase